MMRLFTRRLGSPPVERGCHSNATCPDIFELANGDFAVIGRDQTDELVAMLPPDAGVGPSERLVVIPRRTLLSAKEDIPDA